MVPVARKERKVKVKVKVKKRKGRNERGMASFGWAPTR